MGYLPSLEVNTSLAEGVADPKMLAVVFQGSVRVQPLD